MSRILAGFRQILDRCERAVTPDEMWLAVSLRAKLGTSFACRAEENMMHNEPYLPSIRRMFHVYIAKNPRTFQGAVMNLAKLWEISTNSKLVTNQI